MDMNTGHEDPTAIRYLIWLLEDDELQAATLEQDLIEHSAQLSKDNIIRIPTEAEFLAKLKEVFETKPAERPRLVIADVMLPWAFLGNEPEGVIRPPEVNTTHGFRSAGARCWNALRTQERAAQVRKTPFVFHTVLRKEEFDYPLQYSDENTGYIPKDQPFDALREEIKKVTDVTEE